MIVSLSYRFLWRRFENGILGHLQQELNNPLQLQVSNILLDLFNAIPKLESGFLIQERKDEQLRKVVHYLSVSEVRLNPLDMCLQSASHYQVSHRLYGRRYMLVYLVALANLVAQVCLKP